MINYLYGKKKPTEELIGTLEKERQVATHRFNSNNMIVNSGKNKVIVRRNNEMNSPSLLLLLLFFNSENCVKLL